MTIEDFATRRWRELVAFFEARYGKRRWRQIVLRQVGLRPRTFQRWKAGKLVRRWRKIEQIEAWARAIGFTSAVDAEVYESIRRLEAFQATAAAKCDEEQSKRKTGSAEACVTEWHNIQELISKAMARSDGAYEDPSERC